MGRFQRFEWSGGAWTDLDPDVDLVPLTDADGRPRLAIDIHDSSMATIDFLPVDGPAGRFYLGDEPRLYFDDPDASAPVDHRAMATAFAAWIHETTGRTVTSEEIEALMGGDDPDVDPLDDFVEDTAIRPSAWSYRK